MAPLNLRLEGPHQTFLLSHPGTHLVTVVALVKEQNYQCVLQRDTCSATLSWSNAFGFSYQSNREAQTLMWCSHLFPAYWKAVGPGCFKFLQEGMEGRKQAMDVYRWASDKGGHYESLGTKGLLDFMVHRKSLLQAVCIGGKELP